MINLYLPIVVFSVYATIKTDAVELHRPANSLVYASEKGHSLQHHIKLFDNIALDQLLFTYINQMGQEIVIKADSKGKVVKLLKENTTEIEAGSFLFELESTYQYVSVLDLSLTFEQDKRYWLCIDSQALALQYVYKDSHWAMFKIIDTSLMSEHHKKLTLVSNKSEC